MAKTRIDFVSNSSSCSFIIAVEPERMKTLAKDIAKATINKKDEWHNPNLMERNRRILDFCLNTFQLAFLGELVLETKTEIYNHASLKKCFGTKEDAEREFDRLVDLIKKSKKKNAEPWIKRDYANDTYDEKQKVITHVFDITTEAPVIGHDDMTYHFKRYHFDSDSRKPSEQKKERKERAELLFKAAKEEADGSRTLTGREADTYEITQDTIDNTKDLLEFGYKFSEPKKEMMALVKKYEDLIKRGCRVFYIRQAYSGDGYGDFYIYCEDGADGVSKVHGIDFLGGECL